MTKKSPFFAKIHPNLFENDKFRNIPPKAFLDWMQLLLHCVRNESDGFVSILAAQDLADENSIKELLERNLLDKARFNKKLDVPEVLPRVLPEVLNRGVLTIEESREEIEEKKKLFVLGYLIHDYTDHQTSKAEIEVRREIERNKSQARRNQTRANSNALLQASQKGKGEMKEWLSNAE